MRETSPTLGFLEWYEGDFSNAQTTNVGDNGCREAESRQNPSNKAHLRIRTNPHRSPLRAAFAIQNDAESRPLIAEANAVPLIAESLYSPAAILQENATATLLNLSIASKEHLMSSHGVLDALSHALRHPATPFAAQCAAATIFSLLSVESFRPIIGHKRDIIFGLVEIVRSPTSAARSIKDSLRALFGVSLYPLNRAQMVELGAVQALFSLVVKDGRVGLIEDATAVIAQVAGCEESWEIFKKALGIEVLMDLLDNATGSSSRTKENAVSALLNLVQCGEKRLRMMLEGKWKLGFLMGLLI
ncbi:hypothetical protein DH2020_025870 [Rehmannia glutinosa]|uniref:U-box domain-containing protein n=1 Tax=Rehmannia glutinosa TaxID=99300 RepID=A0ABR0W194_REHGL